MWKENSSKPDTPDTPTEYTITYELSGGTNHKDNPNTYTSDTATIILQDPTRSGYEFLGWYLDAAYTRTIADIPKGSIGNVTLYAKWEEEEGGCDHNWIESGVLQKAATGTVIPKKTSSSSGTTTTPSDGTTTTPGTSQQPSTSTKPGSNQQPSTSTNM